MKKDRLFVRKVISVFTGFVLVLQSLRPGIFYSKAFAQEDVATKTAIVVTPSPEITPTPRPEADQPLAETITETPTPTETVTPTFEPTIIIPTPSEVPQPTETGPPPEPTPTPSPWTFENVELDKKYISPQNSEVTLTFTKLPSPAGNLKIEEITLSKEQIEQTGSLSEKAYDITSNMTDGSFNYNLSLPIPESSKGKAVEVKFSETIDELANSQNVDQPKEVTNNTITIDGLDHFTIFVLVANPSSTTNGMLATIKDAWIDETAANQDVNHGDETTFKVRSRDSGRNYRSLIQFDLTAIPAGSTVSNAKLKLWMTTAPSSNRTYQIYHITSGNWVEGDGGTNNNPINEARWDNKPSIAGSPTSSASVLSTAPDGWVEFDVTSDITAFLTGTPNYGWMVKDLIESESSTARTVTFASKNNGTNNHKPQLSVDFNIATPSNTGPNDTGGFNSPSAQAALTSNSGDDNGYQGSPTNALTSNETLATDNSSGDNNNSDCSDTGTGVDRHIFSNYGISIPTGATINGIEVRQDVKVNNLNDSPFTCVQLSSDGGTTWTSVKQSSLTSTELTPYYFGSSTDLWSRSWSISDFTNFKVRVSNGDTDNSNDSTNFSLDWIPVRIYYTPNASPVANDDDYATDEDAVVNEAAPGVLANDTDADDNPLTAVKVIDPSNGTLTLNADGSFSYTPFENYFGSDSFTYKANDNTADSNTATVNLTINALNDPPSFDPIADRVVDEDSSSQDIAITNVSPGPSDESGQTVTFTATSSDPSIIPNPNVSGSGSTRTLSYTPVPNGYGSTIITVVADDGQSQNNTYQRTFTITVNSVNDAPVIDSLTITPSDPRTNNILSATVTSHDDDNDGVNFSYQWKKNDENVGDDSSTLNLSTNGNGDKNDVIAVTVTANDGNNGTDAETSNQVTVLNSQPEVSTSSDPLPAVEDTPLPIDVSDYIQDVDNDPLVFSIVPNQGPYYGNIVLIDSIATYTPSSNFYSAPNDRFSFQANDGAINSNEAQLFITIDAVNDAPVAVADSYNTYEDTILTVPTPGILENDTDVDGPAMSAVLVSDVSHGVLMFNTDGSFVYTPAFLYHGPDSFTYKANDGSLNSDTVTVSITVVDNVSPTITSAETQDVA